MERSGAVLQFVPGQHSHLVVYLAGLHAGCITHDRTIATFLPPLNHEKLLTWWKERVDEVSKGTRVIYLLVNSGAGGNAKGQDLMGVVMLSMPFSETGRSRAVVEKLLVQQSHRGKGAARLLMSALEADAMRRGRSMLTLDTETGSNAERVYKKLGWTEVGRIPRFGINPDGEWKDETFFYKQL
ncbi:acetyltransferase (GNAT) family protein [Sarocladium implicatum]|nr:acetyltransferase (GNAT) family protein [Sarocladium implicatum]